MEKLLALQIVFFKAIMFKYETEIQGKWREGSGLEKV